MLQEKECQKALLDPSKFVLDYIKKNELSHQVVSDGSNLPYNTVKSFVNGKRPTPRIDTMSKLVGFVLRHKADSKK